MSNKVLAAEHDSHPTGSPRLRYPYLIGAAMVATILTTGCQPKEGEALDPTPLTKPQIELQGILTYYNSLTYQGSPPTFQGLQVTYSRDRAEIDKLIKSRNDGYLVYVGPDNLVVSWVLRNGGLTEGEPPFIIKW